MPYIDNGLGRYDNENIEGSRDRLVTDKKCKESLYFIKYVSHPIHEACRVYAQETYRYTSYSYKR